MAKKHIETNSDPNWQVKYFTEVFFFILLVDHVDEIHRSFDKCYEGAAE